MLMVDAFNTKFGKDKAKRLTLKHLSERDIRAMLYAASNWYEVATNP